MSLKDIFNWLINADLIRGAKITGGLIIILCVLAVIIFVFYSLGVGALSLLNLAVENYGWKTIGLTALKVFLALMLILVILSGILILKNEYNQRRNLKPFSSSDKQCYKALLFKIEKRKLLGYDVSEEIDKIEKLKEKYKINSV